MDAAELTLIILKYAQHLAGVATLAQKTSNDSSGSMVQAQAKLKTWTKDIAALEEQVCKKSPNSEETLSPLLEHYQKEAEMTRNQLAHVKAEARDLRGAQEGLKSALRHLSDGEANITGLHELF